MSVPVDLAALHALIEELGPEALLATVTPEATPHLVSVLTTSVDDRLTMGGGRRTRANIAVNPRVTLLWPSVHDGAYRLIVDGTATIGADDQVAVEPTYAVLHRIAGVEGDEPNCLPIEG